VSGGKEGVVGDIQAGEDNQVPLWGLLFSRHLNIGVSQIGGECIVADFDKCGG